MRVKPPSSMAGRFRPERPRPGRRGIEMARFSDVVLEDVLRREKEKLTEQLENTELFLKNLLDFGVQDESGDRVYLTLRRGDFTEAELKEIGLQCVQIKKLITDIVDNMPIGWMPERQSAHEGEEEAP